MLDSGEIRFFGNVRYGQDLTLEDLKQHYNAVIFSTGAIRDAMLGVPGIDAEGSYGAADFVSWFDGHPDVPRTWPLEAASVGVIGNGNVALDVSRMLIKHADDLLVTEIPENVYEGLKANPISDLHLFGRRGPKYVKFTPLELRELGEVRDVDMVIDERDFAHDDPYADEVVARNKQVTVMTRIMDKWRDEQRAREAGETEPSSRRLHLHFWSKPVELVTEDRPRCRRSSDRAHRPRRRGRHRRHRRVRDYPDAVALPRRRLLRLAARRDPVRRNRGVIPNDRGRVLDLEGKQVPGVYATGWIKRGPIGLIGHTKSDAMETLERLMEDSQTWWQPEHVDAAIIPQLLSERGVPYTNLDGWHRLDDHELSLGEAAGRTRIKVVSRDEMTRVSRGE